MRIRFDKYDGSATTFLGDAYIDTQTLEINMTGGAASRITARVRKDEATGWIFAEATIQAIDGELKIGSQIQYSPKQSGATVSGWICPYISRHLLSLNPLLACCRRYSRGER